MTLSDWIESSGLTRTAFASAIGVSPATVTRLCNGEQYPSLPVMQAIQTLTGGAVLPNDFPNERNVA